MVVALFNGMAKHESTIVVATYYIAMTLFASTQGLCVFNLMPQLRALSAAGFVFGVLLCICSVVWMTWLRAKSTRRTPNVDRSSLIDGNADVVPSDAGCGASPGVAECGPVTLRVPEPHAQHASAPSAGNGPPPLSHRHTT